MSFGLSPSDVIKGLEIAHWIYKTGFTAEHRSDIRWQNFQQEIKGVEDSLRLLDRALRDAHDQYRTARQPLLTGTNNPPAAYDPLSIEFDTERRQIVGEFVKTLEECHKVLQDNRGAAQQRGTLVQAPYSVLWAIETESKVENLRKRLRLHMKKISMVINRLSLGLMTDNAARLDDLMGLGEQNLDLSAHNQLLLQQLYSNLLASQNGQRPPEQLVIEDNHVASQRVAQIFEQNLSIHAPSKFSQRDCRRRDLPLIEGFDVLLQNIESSLEDTSGSHIQTPKQYLTFLKARWLLEVIRESHDFETARPGFYYKRAVNQIARQIQRRTRMPGLVSFPDEDLLLLSSTDFLIWQEPEVIVRRAEAVTARPDEQEVAKLDLVPEYLQGTECLYIFRRSGHQYRLVRESKEEGIIDRTQLKVNTREDCLIPRYAQPGIEDPPCEMTIFSREEESIFKFENGEDLFSFQQALMGYQVTAEGHDVSVSFAKGLPNCRGLVQIWQDSSQSTSVSKIQASPSEGSSTVDLRDEKSISRSSFSRQSGIARSIVTTTLTQLEDGVEADETPLPALAIFTKIKDDQNRRRLAIIYIELSLGINIQRYPNDEREDLDIYLEKVDKKHRIPFSIHVVYSDLDRNGKIDPNTWNLLPLRRPKVDLRRVTTKKTTAVVLSFASPSDKSAFEDALTERLRLRDSHETLKRWEDTGLQFEADKSGRHSMPLPTRSRISSTTSTSQASPRFSLSPPIHGSMDFGKEFGEAVAHATDVQQPNRRGFPSSAPSASLEKTMTRRSTHSALTVPIKEDGATLDFSRSRRNNDAETSTNKPSTKSGLRGLFGRK